MADVITYFNYLEGGICLRINRLSRKAWIRRLFAAVSKLGDGGFWVLMAALLYVLQGPQSLPSILHMAVTGGIGVLVYKALKNRLIRERPYINHGGILCGTAPLDRYSFPSGHTLHAVGFTILLWAFEPTTLLLAAPFTVLVAVSRVVLGLHYPSDVAVGAVLGAVLAGTSLALF